MPNQVDKGFVSEFTNLGIYGAVLVVFLVIVVVLINTYVKAQGKALQSVISDQNSQSTHIVNLCKKLDDLITSFGANTQKLSEVLLSNDKDQKTTIDLLKQLLTLTIDTNNRVIKVEDRTHFYISGKEYKYEDSHKTGSQ